MNAFRQCTACLLFGVFAADLPAEDALAAARALLLRGRYAEALAEADALKAEHPLAAALIQADAYVATGELYEATKVLKEQEVDRASVAVLRRLAQIDQLWRKRNGRWRKLDEQDVVGHWLRLAESLQGSSVDEVDKSLQWFADKGGDFKPADADEALALAQGLAELARWKREAKWFNIAVNDVLGAAEKAYPADWRLPYQRALLFAEKHNEPAAVDSLNAALAKNGSAAELHALRARLAIDKYDVVSAKRALEQARRTNPHLPEIVLVDADICFAELRPADANAVLHKVWQEGHNTQEMYGRMVAAEEILHESPEQIREMFSHPPSGLQRAPHYLAQGDAFDRMRRFGQAAEAYRRAMKVPEYPGIRARLAQQLLRLGEEEEGAKLLIEAQREDPFDVRVKNSIAVLEVLSTYATLETDHFILRFDRGQDELLARYMAEYLEEDVYPDLAKRFAFQPKGKSLIEIYNRARNTSGHGWFSARMVGVPGLHTIGACGGRIVALASPTDMPRPYNWARVLRHEFVHLLNLEQTSFNVPHWVTEGLAVSAEDRPRPSAWLKLLTQRYADDDLFTLDNINFGFIRPSDSGDWTCAYAQAQIYIEFLNKAYGDESIPKLLAAFAKNLSTNEAIEKASGVKVADFEGGYREYVGELVKSWGLLDSTPSQNIERLKAKLADQPENADLLAALAAAHLGKGELPLAKKFATQAAKLIPKQPTAAFVLASLAKAQDPALAERIAQAALDLSSPHEGLLLLLAEGKLANKQKSMGEKLLLLGKKRFPSLDQWNQHLARLYAQQKDEAKLEPILAELSLTQEDDASIPAKLVELALARQDFAGVKQWSQATLRIDVRHAAAHAGLAQAFMSDGKPDAALPEWEAAVERDDKHPQWKLELARLLIKAGERDRAEALLENLVKTAPGLPGLVEAAQELRK
jgi:predicted Zn-dependent protease